MTYQNPAFMVKHPNALIAIASIIAGTNASGVTDDDKRALVDSRQGEVATYTATGANAGVLFLLGTSPIPRVNRVVIPAGHTFSGFQIDIVSDDNSPGFPSPTTRASSTPSDSGVIDISFALVTTDQDWLFQTPGSVAESFQLGEFWIGERKALTTGDGRVDPGFEREYEHDAAEDSFGGRTTSLELAPERRKFSLHIRDLDPADTDFATLEEVMRDGRTKPFWYWTPDSTDTGPYLVKLTRAARRKQSSKVPLTHSRYEVQLEMLEQVT